MNSRIALLSTSRELDPWVQSRLAKLILMLLLLAGLCLLWISGRQDIKLLGALKAVQIESPRFIAASSDGNSANSNQTKIDDSTLISELPAVFSGDAQIRYVSKIAHEQDVMVVQMQSEFITTAAEALGRRRITLQLRGDYRGIKNVWVSLLAKYPGLVVERLTLRHHADASPASSLMPLLAAPPPPSDRADDEADIELIQYLQPARLVQ